MAIKILTVYQAENKQLRLWYNPKNVIPHSEIVRTIQEALNEPTIENIQDEWAQADKHRAKITERLIDELTRLQVQSHRREEMADNTNRIMEELRNRIIKQQNKINFLKSCISTTELIK